MNQNFSFSSKFGKAYVAAIRSGRKDMTNRFASEFRAKCKINDLMHCFLDLRSENRKRLFDVPVQRRILWFVDDMPQPEVAHEVMSPRYSFSWRDFAIKDGLSTYTEFYEYFQNHKKGKKFFCFIWDPAQRLKKITLMRFIKKKKKII
ncbi:MAG: hypothetical protein R6U96_04690 [Promethearchaeia archaeon]